MYWDPGERTSLWEEEEAGNKDVCTEKQRLLGAFKSMNY